VETKNKILTINAGSSSIKLAIYTNTGQFCFKAEATNIGQANGMLKISSSPQSTDISNLQVPSMLEAINKILENYANQFFGISGIGHRIVHGGPNFINPTLINNSLIRELNNLSIFDPEHLPIELELIKFFGSKFNSIPQVAVFDTFFFKDMPNIAKLLPLPRKYSALGLRRYGFHGLSYEYLLQEFEEKAGLKAAQGRIILAHLGSGASLTAIKDKKVIDTTMSFSPASGILMGTRSGDLDPAILMFLHKQTGMTIEQFNHMIHFDSGLLGVSEISADMEILLRESSQNEYAKIAVDLFCYQVLKAIGSLSAVLGGLDSLIFAGGIAEKASIIRTKICENLSYLGLSLDQNRNKNHDFLISANDSKIGVHLIQTDEASIIAKHTKKIIEGE
jgi:acetate kinase